MKLALPWKKTILGLILLASLVLHFYNLPQNTQFQGDQGRDAIIVADIFREKDPVFIGPVTSVGNMYLGPLYYYFMLPFLRLSYPSPLGPVYAVAAIGVLTTYLIWRLGKEIVGETAALTAAFFYTFSAVATSYSRFSWNPNVMPLVSLLMVYWTYLAWKKNPKYWLWVMVAFSVLTQLHYLSLLTAPAAGAIWLTAVFQQSKKAKKGLKNWWQATKKTILPMLAGVMIFLASLAPLVLFDIKHQGINFQALKNLVTAEEHFSYNENQAAGSGLIRAIKETEGRGMHILFEYMIGKNRPLNQALLYLSAYLLIAVLIDRHQQKKSTETEWLLLSFLGFSILGTAFYEHSIFDHYIAYLFPLTALLYGYLFTRIKPKQLAVVILVVFAGYFLNYNLPKMPLAPTGWTVADIRRTSEAILEKLEPGEKYSVILLSESGDIEGQNYRYFLTTGHTRPVPAEEQGSVDSLVIIDEQGLVDDVGSLPMYEIVTFPDKDNREVFAVEGGPTITILRRTTQAPAEQLE